MEDLHFKNQDHLELYLRNLEFIGIGSESICYKTSNGLVLKHLCGEAYEPKTKEELLQFKDIAIKNYIFAQALVYIENEIVGVLMPYINGKTLENGLYNIKIESLIKSLDDLVEATKKLSTYGISVYDVCDVNVIYNRGRLYLIDTLNYTKSDDANLFSQNMFYIMINIYCNLFTNKILKFIKTIPELKDFKTNQELLNNPSYIVKVLKTKLDEYFGYEIKTISEASKKLKY